MVLEIPQHRCIEQLAPVPGDNNQVRAKRAMERRKLTYRLSPTKRQANGLAVLLRSHRQLYNAALEQRIDAWKRRRVSLSYQDRCGELTDLRRQCPAFAEANCSSSAPCAASISPSRPCSGGSRNGVTVRAFPGSRALATAGGSRRKRTGSMGACACKPSGSSRRAAGSGRAARSSPASYRTRTAKGGCR